MPVAVPGRAIDVLTPDRATYALTFVADLPPAPGRASSPRGAGRRRASRSKASVVALLAILVALLGGQFSTSGPVSAAPVQDPGVATSVGPTPTAEPNTDADPQPATDPTTDEDDRPTDNSEQVEKENRRIWLVVAGLVLVAVALLVLTIRYWRQTKPVGALASPTEEATEASAAEPADETSEETSEESAATASEVGSEEASSSRDQPTLLSDRSGGRRSRRAVAGADHSSADDAWEPRGTGEHDRIEKPRGPSLARPTAEQRQAAYRARRDR